MDRYEAHAGSYMGYYYKSGLHLQINYEAYQVYVKKILEISEKKTEEVGV